MKKVTKQEQEYVKDELLKLIDRGDTIYTVLTHVSKSGLSRSISAYVIRGNKPYKLDYLISYLLNLPLDKTNGGIKVSGVGMDMGIHLVYSVSYILFNTNYAFEQRWL